MGSFANAQTQTVTFSYTGAPITIPPARANVAAVAEINVPTVLTINSVTVQVQVTYPAAGDLTMYLFSPNGTRTILLQNNCGNLANVNTTFDDTAQSKFSDFCPVEPGRGPFRGNEPLANSRGEISAGNWDLVIQNTKSDTNTGLLQTFAMTIAGTPITRPGFDSSSVVNSASLIGGVVAPGELVSIFGLALGPQAGVAATPGTAPTSLGGTTVMFNGTPVPILYSSYYQLNVQAPYALTPGATARIQVQNSGGTSSSISLDVLSSAAGLFTAQTNGRGQVLAVNQNGTINSVSNPAAAGSYVSLYAEGLGAVTPAVNEGTPAPTNPLSRVNGPVTVVAGGLTAPVLFAGLAPGYAGLYQINIQIPPTTVSGPVRLFLVTPNGYSSQGGVFLQVRQ
ncbi:MAG: proprotein convertase P-domain-containing protein [Bryobacteraceae bacterium]